MATKKTDKDVVPVLGVKMWPVADLMTYDNGKILPRENFDDIVEPDNLTPEEEYEVLLRNGFDRIPRIEEGLDMATIDPSLLK